MALITLGDLKTIWEAIRDRAYDATNDMYKVQSIQKKWRDSFGGASLDATKWDQTIGSGGSLSVSAGQLTMASGATANSETYILSKETFTVPFKFSIGFTLSQRIANQTFLVEAVSVDPITGVPDGKHCAALLFDGVTATQAKYRVQNSAGTPLDSAASTFPTTASGSYFEMEPFGDECWFHGGTLDSNNGRANSYRRHQQIPEPNAIYKIRLRWLNGSVAPASTTSAVIQYVACQDYAELTAEITAGRGQAVAGQAIGVSVLSMPTTTITPVTPSTSTLNSAATTNATSVKASAGTLYSIMISNTAASARYLKIYNKASAPTVGTDVPMLTIPIAAGTVQPIELGVVGVRLSAGIALAITAAAADTDTSVIGASEVKVITTYI